MVPFSPLFLEVAAAAGLEVGLARDTLARSLRRLNIDPHAMNPADLSRALPIMQDTLAMFFTAEEAHQRMRALSGLVTRSDRSTAA